MSLAIMQPDASQVATLQAVAAKAGYLGDINQFIPMIQTSSWDEIEAAMRNQPPAFMPGAAARGISLGGVLGGIGTVLGGPVGGVIGAAVGNAFAPTPKPQGASWGGGTGIVGPVASGIGSAVAGPAGGFIGGLVGSLVQPGQKPGTAVKPYSVTTSLLNNNCPPGYHLVDKPWARNTCVRNRKMNVMNRRALSRANTRVMGFARAATPALKSLGFTVSKTRHPHGLKVRGVSSSSRGGKKGCGCGCK